MKLKFHLIGIFFFLSLSIMAQPGFNSPSYYGGEAKMYKFINDRLVYPPSAWNAGIEGRVVVRFVVSEKGEVRDVKVFKSLHPDCDSIAVNIVRSMPRWIPGQERGKNAATDYILPVVFRMSMLDIEGEIYASADSMPEFPGGFDSLFVFISKNLRWPNTEIDFQGRVTIRFIVTKEGKIMYPKIVKGIAPVADEEALRVVRLMPDWIPGRRNGEAVNVYFTIPIVFKLF
jgi:TonB family protein